MLEFRDTGIGPVHSVVHRAVGLPELCQVGLKDKVQRAVGQTAKAAVKQLIRRAGIDDGAGERLPFQLDAAVFAQLQNSAGLGVQAHGDVGVVQHFLKQGGIALPGHPLPGILEIAVVPGEEHGHPGRGIGVDLLGGLPPLLHGVLDKYMLIDIVRQGGDLRVLALPQLQDGDLFLRAVGGDQLVAQALALPGTEGRLQRGQVEGHGILHPPALRRNVGDHPVLILPPGGEAGQVVKHPLIIRMENVRTILMDQYAHVIHAVVGVSAHVGALFTQEHPLPAAFRQFPGGRRAGKARTDDQAVKLSHCFTTFRSCSGIHITLNFSTGFYLKK